MLFSGLIEFSSFLVGYNDREMVLDGQFSYDNRNQRALPFNVIIEEIAGPLRTYYGSNSKCFRKEKILLNGVISKAWL